MGPIQQSKPHSIERERGYNRALFFQGRDSHSGGNALEGTLGTSSAEFGFELFLPVIIYILCVNLCKADKKSILATWEPSRLLFYGIVLLGCQGLAYVV
jgi:hypothetical protein